MVPEEVTEEISKEQAAALLRWYVEMGVDEAIAPMPTNFFENPGSSPETTIDSSPEPARERPTSRDFQPPNAQPSVAVSAEDAPIPADEAIALAKKIAAQSTTLDALTATISDFDGCPLKSGARNTVFTDGVMHADLLIIGEAPGRDEDRVGKPFVGRAGQLLDKMLASIGRSRENDTLITNSVFWRPPGNRAPTEIESAICRPFLDRLIELCEPRVIVLAGGAPLKAIFGVSGIMRARGTWRDLKIGEHPPIPTLPIFHPAFLLRQPDQKRLAWHDLLAVKARLTED